MENMTHKITKILKLIIAPFLNKDGGDIEFSSYENNTVYVKFLGKCNGCPYAARTLKERVEKNLVSYLPEVKKAELI
ncbi:MAG: NifU family protein [Alphaproteobacteria bacterium]|nr:NifU family protein [Alphaproteobacteria bacterium]